MNQFKIGKYNISWKRMAVLAAVLFVVSVIPLIMLGRYNVMCVDDYDYGRQVYQTYQATGSFLASVRTAWRQNLEFYQNWQGTYVSCFLMALCPMNFRYDLAFLVPVLMITAFAGSSFLLGRHIFTKWFGLDRATAVIIVCMILFLFYQTMEAPFEGIYWYNGATHYVLLQSVFFLMLLSESVALHSVKKPVTVMGTVAAAVLAILVGGGNLVTALQAEIIMLFVLLYVCIRDRRRWFAAILPFITGSAGFLVNVLAPGNTMRAGADTDTGYSAVVSIILSFYNGIVFMVKWTSAAVIFVWLLLLPVMWWAVKKSNRRFEHPIIVSLLCYCVLSAMFTPTLYAVGMVGLSRVDNIIQMVYYLFLFMVTVYWLGYFCHRESKAAVLDPFFSMTGSGIVLVGLLLLFVLIVFTPDKNTFHSVSAVRSLANGEAKVFYEESMERYAMYTDESITDVVVRPYSQRPALFAVEDLSEDPGNWLNLAVTQYFRKGSVRLGR